ncbi:MAG: sigma-54-dependent transcriptional regulator [Desulfovibrionaceae bacterium]
MTDETALFVTPTSLAIPFYTSFKKEKCEVHMATDMRTIKAHLEKHKPLFILSRTQLPGYRADELLTFLHENNHTIPVILISEYSPLEEIEKYLQHGIKDFWEEPIVEEKLMLLLQEMTAISPPSTHTIEHTENVPIPLQQKNIHVKKITPIGQDITMQRVTSLAKRIAPSKATILINGESGTGKEVFAKYLHALSDRADKPFVAVNCAALPEHLLESELFGHEKGSFTGAISKKLGKFELAQGGTILLDEISEMPISLQAKLLRVLQENEIDRVGGSHPIPVDVRVIATSNRHLENWIESGHFRQDLYFRLNVLPITLPPLRERGNDIALLAEYFLTMYTKEYSLVKTSLGSDAESWLLHYSFPGNVRELQNLIERSVLLSGGGTILPQHFLLEPTSWPFIEDEQKIHSFTTCQSDLQNTVDLSKALVPLHEMERIMILKGLESTSGNRTHAADLLGISVRTLRNKINEYREKGFHID